MYTDNTMNASLKQGQYYNSLKRDFNTLVGKKQLKLIEETTMPNLGFLEPMDTMGSNGKTMSGSNNVLEVHNKNDSQAFEKLRNLETQFNSKIAEYNNVYNTLLQKVKGSVQYKNEVVRTPDGKYYFINKFGVARPFTQTAWNSKPSNCPTSYTEIDMTTLNQFVMGLNYVPGQPCNLDGTFITTVENNTNYTYYVDSKGYRHHVPSDLLLQELQNGPCQNVLSYQVESKTANMFPQSTPMTSASTCNEILFSETSPLKTLKGINQELSNIAGKMYDSMKGLSAKSSKYNAETDKIQAKLVGEMGNLNNEREHILKMERNIRELEGQYEDSEIMYKSNLYQYIAWGLFTVTLTGIAMHHFTR